MTTALADRLLESEIPSIRYFTLRNLLNLPESHPDVIAVQKAIMQTNPVTGILAKQTPKGHWDDDNNFYQPKYTSTHWSMMLLTEFHVQPDDERFQRGIDFMLEATQDRLFHWLEQGVLCFWGNMLRYVAHGNRLDDARVKYLLDGIEQEALQLNWTCPHNSGLPCAWGVARTLWALAAIPSEKRTEGITKVIENGLDFLLTKYPLHEAAYPTNGTVHKMWHKLNFPLFYQTDILFVLRVLADLGQLRHAGTQDALNWLREKQLKNGRWRGASPYRSRTWSMLGSNEETSRWVSLQAAMILKAV